MTISKYMVNEPEEEYDSFINDLLDLYYNMLKMNSSLKLNNGRELHSSRYWNIFLTKLNESYPDLYDNFDIGDGLQLSPIGLWCLSMPLIAKQETIGIITVGYVLIKGKEAESKSILKQSLHAKGSSPAEIEYFLNLLESIGAIDEGKFNEKFLRELCLVGKYIEAYRQRETKEEERFNNIKNLSQNLAHQFLLPIQSILANSENIMKEYDSLNAICRTVEMMDMIHDIFLEVQKLALSADNLRNWVSLEHDIYRYDFSRSSIFPIIMDSINLFRKEANYRNITINDPHIIGDAVPLLKISQEHLKRVFYNLLNNAIKYSFDGSPSHKRFIDITCKYSGDHYVIEISNYGIGMLPEEIESGKIFEVGYRGKLAKDRNRYGSGLGLSSVKKITEDHGGDITVKSIPMSSKHDQMFYQPYLNTISISLPLNNI